MRLINYDFDIVHLAEVKHQAADALSELLTNRADDTELDDELPVVVITDDNAINFECIECYDDETSVACVKDPDKQILPILEKIICEQASDAYCDQVRLTVTTPKSASQFTRTASLYG